MSEATTLFRKFEVTVGDRTWILPRPILAVERAYTAYLEKKAAEAINRNRQALGMVYGDAIKQWTSACVGNFYGWMQGGFLESLASADNVAHWIMFWVNASHPAEGDPLHIATEKDAYILYTDPKNKAAWDTAMNEAFNDPNPLLPA
jgi:hypothetical protein